MTARAPYRADFGAIHHEAGSGFLFTVNPAVAAPSVAAMLNKASAAPDAGDLARLIEAAHKAHYHAARPERDALAEALRPFEATQAARNNHHRTGNIR